MLDIVIIGGGPMGIYASSLASLHLLKGVLIESQDKLGGQLTSLYPEKDIIDLPGFDHITAKEFIDKLNIQRESMANPLEVKLEENVIGFDEADDGYIVKTNKGNYSTKTILIASGMGMFTPRKIGVKNEEYFDNIIYSINNIQQYKGKDVVVLGGGDSAVDWSIMLSKIAHKVSIVHRRNEFRAQSSSVRKMQEVGVNILTPYVVDHLEGNTTSVENIFLKNNLDSSIISLQVDTIFVNYGFIATPLAFDIESVNNLIKVDTTCMTSRNNIFAVGNCVTYQGKVKNITSGLGEVVTAITRIDQIINPNKNIPIHF